MYRAHAAGARRYAASEKQQSEDINKAYSEIQDRPRNHPNARDITDGDALNTLLDVLLVPANADASLQQIKTPLRPDVIANIPFDLASEGMTICLGRMTIDGLTNMLYSPAMDKVLSEHHRAMTQFVMLKQGTRLLWPAWPPDLTAGRNADIAVDADELFVQDQPDQGAGHALKCAGLRQLCARTL